MPSLVTTSEGAYELARLLCDEYEQRKSKEKELNARREQKGVVVTNSTNVGPSRTVTEIDYRKHERTVSELDRQEKEEHFQKKKLEAAQWCTLDHEHGPNCKRPVAGCSHDHQKEWQIYEKSTTEKTKAAERFRQEGNEYYRKQNYGLAAVHYRKALLQFDYTFPEGEEEEKAVESVKVPCLLNLAACKCQQEEWDEVLTQCRLALEIDPRSVKAFYRTGLAHLARDHFDLARDALMSAYEIEPNNREVRNALEQLKKNRANYKVRRKEVYKEMVAGSTATHAEEAGEPLLSVEPEQQPLQEPVSNGNLPPSASPPAIQQANDAPTGEQLPHGLRQRHRPQRDQWDAVDAEWEEEDEEENGDSGVESFLTSRMLNGILLVALILGLLSIILCAVAFLSATDSTDR